ncbi:AAA family ATPase [Geodermatophilus sp. DSM 44513]|uniref:AAA family ATPase n=1 Tax=Geodermatophilus sp. DSM 44513 TaxID=1528104 RepID=UPI001277DEEA|nr:AAA family ATPase [Geodermatophilus sp. DSM 44513]WNV73850.1 AAA family ATPase [Geodermatophilus sp. DSM 44513]
MAVAGGRVVLLNGLPASGKSVAARWIADRNPGSLCLDIDTLRTFLGDWRSDFRRAGEWVRPLALALLATHARSGGTVLVPQLFTAPDEVQLFRDEAVRAGATFDHVLLLVEPDVAYERLVARAAASGPGSVESTILSLVDRDGGPEDLRGMHERMTAAFSADPGVTTVDTRDVDRDTLASYLAARLGATA